MKSPCNAALRVGGTDGCAASSLSLMIYHRRFTETAKGQTIDYTCLSMSAPIPEVVVVDEKEESVGPPPPKRYK